MRPNSDSNEEEELLSKLKFKPGSSHANRWLEISLVHGEWKLGTVGRKSNKIRWSFACSSSESWCLNNARAVLYAETGLFAFNNVDHSNLFGLES